MSKNYWTKRRPDGKWATKATGASRASRVSNTQSEAWDHTKDLARKNQGEAFLCNRSGQIRERNTYTGHDPRNIKG
jgi:hypothetical protein